MKHTKLFSTMMLAGVLSATGGEVLASPEAAVEYSMDGSDAIALNSGYTTLRSATATCPEAGYLVASATAEFYLEAIPKPSRPGATYGIIKGGAPIDAGYKWHVVSQYTDYDAVASASTQRVVNCGRNQSVMLNFIAKAGSGNSNAWKPTLVIEFFRDKI